ncbi:MAG: F0F1 ATP synthase subunit delta [Haliea sp.]
MLIDWFTVGAQLLNFLILVWLLKRFLYQPILDAIDVREARIAAELADAEATKIDAKAERDAFVRRNEEFDRQHSERLSQAKEEVKTEHQRLMDEARQAADDMRVKRQDDLEREQQALNDEITRLTRKEVFSIARKTLGDLAETGLEARMSEVFMRRLREMDARTKEGLATTLQNTAEPAIVRSAFELPESQRAAIQNALNEIFSAEVHIRFEAAPDLVSGIELSTNGQKVAWSIADYLATLEKQVVELLQAPAKAEPGSS